MCTSFMFRGDDTIIAMNYDNNGRNLKLAPYKENLFLVTLHSFGKDRPLFGIRSDGVMVNQQVVNECDGGKFRIGLKTLHTAKLLENILIKKKRSNRFKEYFDTHTIVNPPQNSLHVFVACADGESYIIEPGRGILTYPKSERYVAMSNCPLFDVRNGKEPEGFGVERQLLADSTLRKAPDNFGVADAFKLLDALHQTDPLWTTEFSFVYSRNENKVYYCYDHKYDEISEYQLK